MAPLAIAGPVGPAAPAASASAPAKIGLLGKIKSVSASALQGTKRLLVGNTFQTKANISAALKKSDGADTSVAATELKGLKKGLFGGLFTFGLKAKVERAAINNVVAGGEKAQDGQEALQTLGPKTTLAAKLGAATKTAVVATGSAIATGYKATTGAIVSGTKATGAAIVTGAKATTTFVKTNKFIDLSGQQTKADMQKIVDSKVGQAVIEAGRETATLTGKITNATIVTPSKALGAAVSHGLSVTVKVRPEIKAMNKKVHSAISKGDLEGALNMLSAAGEPASAREKLIMDGAFNRLAKAEKRKSAAAAAVTAPVAAPAAAAPAVTAPVAAPVAASVQ